MIKNGFSSLDMCEIYVSLKKMYYNYASTYYIFICDVFKVCLSGSFLIKSYFLVNSCFNQKRPTKLKKQNTSTSCCMERNY